MSKEKDLIEQISKIKAEGGDAKGLETELADLQKQQTEFEKKEAELAQYEKDHPTWNVDNMSEDKHDRTIINKGSSLVKKTEKETAEDMTTFFKEHGEEAKKFALYSNYDDAHKYLKENMHLVCEHLGSYLVIWAVDLQVEEKFELMKRVARQAIVVQYILELAKTMQRDPRSCVDAFFTRIKTAEKQYQDAFEEEYRALIKRVEDRAVARLEEATKKQQEEEAAERESRLGPGGLDPLEVIEELPIVCDSALVRCWQPMLCFG